MTRLKAIRLPVSANLKLGLVMLAFVIVAGTLYYTQLLVEKLKASENRSVNFYAYTLTKLSSSEQSSDDLSDFLLDLSKTIDFPMIVTDPNFQPQPTIDRNGVDTSYIEYVRNPLFDTTATPYQQRLEIIRIIEDMRGNYDPLPIYFISQRDSVAITDSGQVQFAVRDSVIINYVFYDDSDMVKQLRMLPYIEIIIIAMFILVGYISFSYVKRNEQSNIWVGMAKETAHQLGTPLSSMLGWIELLRLTPDDRQQVLEAADEMQRDVERLNKVAQRFSKIGSAAEVHLVELNSVIRNVVRYFERRLPHLGKTIKLLLEESEPVYVTINIDLFEWVFENMVRNAADAIERRGGEIRFRVRSIRGTAVIDIKDNGRGIDPKIRKDIFRPGFSTKRRGWGLGLSLAKRIVEEYHGGKIIVKDSSPKGTTFRITLQAYDLLDHTLPMHVADALGSNGTDHQATQEHRTDGTLSQ